MVDWITLSAVCSGSGIAFAALLGSAKAFLGGVPAGENRAVGRVKVFGDSIVLEVDFLTGVVVAESGFNLGT
jgi:hypothetical protein